LLRDGQTNGANCIADHYKVLALPLRQIRINEARQVARATIGQALSFYLTVGFAISRAFGV
jgi:hypothetical protein